MSESEAAEQAVRLILRHFRRVKDPRVKRTRKHPLVNVLFMALCAALCGADGFKAMARFARAKRDFFRRYLSLEHGTPSTDTFRRVFGALCADSFESVFRTLIGQLAQTLKGQVLALDGKTVRGALKAGGGALHLLHAWASEQQLLLAQAAVEGAPGEVGALPELIRALEVEGAVVTVDANGCTREVAEACQEKKADFVLALKGNRGPLHAFVFALFVARAWQGGLPRGKARRFTQQQAHHGRFEVREAWAADVSRWPCDWPGLRSAVLVRRLRYLTPSKPPQEDWHLYVSSLPARASRLAHVIRRHWGVENGLHWVLDVQMGEDRRRVRHQRAAENLARLSRLALTLLKRETSLRAGIELKRKEAGWDDTYLTRLLSVGLP